MAKYERGTARSTASINDELEKIQNSLADKFDRKPSSGEPNQLETNLDMNGNRIYNLPDPQSSKDAVSKDYVDNLALEGLPVNLGTDKVFESIANAKADATLAIGDTVRTLGYYIPNDGGGAEYVVVAGATGINDVGSYHDCTNGLQLELIHRDSINIKQFGCKGDGVFDNQFRLLAALDYAEGGKVRVLVPEGVFLTKQVDVPTGTILEGIGSGSVLKFINDPSDPANHVRVMLRVFGDQSDPSLPSNNSLNVTIKDLKLVGTVDVDAFSEFRHLVMCQGVTNFKLLDCVLEGFQGDGLVVRSGNTSAQAENYDVTVEGCTFDGVNKDNRNAISITDCTGMTIRGNSFRRCTRPDQPGAIDIEPNTPDTFVKLSGIVIRDNYFTDIGGNIGAISVLFTTDSSDFDQHPQNINIESNTIDGCVVGLSFRHVQADSNRVTGDRRINMVVKDNHVENASERGMWIYGMNGVSIEGNTFSDCQNANRIGWSDSFRGCSNIDFRKNKMIRCGSVDGYSLIIYQSNNLNIEDNLFLDSGITAGTFGVAINFSTGVSTDLRILGNVIQDSIGVTTAAISNDVGASGVLVEDLTSNRFGNFSVQGVDFGNRNFVTLTSGMNLSDGSSGKTFFMDNAAGITATLPEPANGLEYTFIVKTAPTGASYRIQTTSAAGVIYGTINETVDADAGTVQGASAKSFVSGSALVGDWMNFKSDGTNWYINASTQANFGIS